MYTRLNLNWGYGQIQHPEPTSAIFCHSAADPAGTLYPEHFDDKSAFKFAGSTAPYEGLKKTTVKQQIRSHENKKHWRLRVC